jgi:hypothetical protein
MPSEGGEFVEMTGLLAVDEAIVLPSFDRSAAPAAVLRCLAGTRTMAASAHAGRPT